MIEDVLRRTTIGLAVAIVLSSSASGQTATSLPELGIPESCGVQMKTHNFTVEQLDRVSELGFRIVRRGFYWMSIEDDKGVYQFGDYDPQMERARCLPVNTNEKRPEILFCLFQAYEEMPVNPARGGQPECTQTAHKKTDRVSLRANKLAHRHAGQPINK